jgi:hypothetical protein
VGGGWCGFGERGRGFGERWSGFGDRGRGFRFGGRGLFEGGGFGRRDRREESAGFRELGLLCVGDGCGCDLNAEGKYKKEANKKTKKKTKK